jgi:hypothetical protein
LRTLKTEKRGDTPLIEAVIVEERLESLAGIELPVRTGFRAN